MTTFSNLARLSAPRSLLGRVGFEVNVTALMMGNNCTTSALPPVLFTLAASVHFRQSLSATLHHLAVSTVLFVLFQYVFDTSNQAQGAQEDALNKPHRPIPRGLITVQGAMRRFWLAMPLYTLVGWYTGTLVWVLLWQAVLVWQNFLSRPHQYFYVKPACMALGATAQLAAAWEVVAPLDSIGWTWVLVIAVAFNLALPFEDVRDMEGDRRVGRRTIPLMIGHWPLRIWFALYVAVLPAVLHWALFRHSHAPSATVYACAGLIAAVCWTASLCSVLLRTVRADQATYLLYTGTYCAALACGTVLL